MFIKMIGIDHDNASLAYREKFSFTRKKIIEIMTNMKDKEGVLGCIILSTCNRMEIWISTQEDCQIDIYNSLCQMEGLDSSKYVSYFKSRSGLEAVKHLFYLACGMKSKILGEDQIITQVKEALNFSRENFSTDKVLEVLFRMAITSGKKVKTNVHLSKVDSSAIHYAIHSLKQKGHLFSGKKCMVIGNGEMGKLAALALKEEGAQVIVTVRQYKSGIVEIPKGCERINYGERMEVIPDCHIVVSATASPNFTLTKSEFDKIQIKHPLLMIDLAVPRDIDQELKKNDNIQIYDIDDFDMGAEPKELSEQKQLVESILQEGIEEFMSWYECKDMIPMVHNLSEQAALDVSLRLDKVIKSIEIEQEEKKHLEQSIETAANKVVSKMMFCLRDTVSADTFRECMEALKQIY